MSSEKLSNSDFEFFVVHKDQEKGEKEKELILQDEMSSKVWVCTSTHSSTKVMVLDATQPSDLHDSFYACNTHVVCIASVPGKFAGHIVSREVFSRLLPLLFITA